MHWNWNEIATVGLFVLGLLGALSAVVRRLLKQNAEQLAESRRIKRELFGEDQDNPNAPKGPSLRELLNATVANTKGVPEQILELRAGLGKANDRMDALERRVGTVESVIIRSAPPIT